jgi:hypothetical protein
MRSAGQDSLPVRNILQAAEFGCAHCSSEFDAPWTVIAKAILHWDWMCRSEQQHVRVFYWSCCSGNRLSSFLKMSISPPSCAGNGVYGQAEDHETILGTSPWQGREDFEPRSAAGSLPYFLPFSHFSVNLLYTLQYGGLYTLQLLAPI